MPTDGDSQTPTATPTVDLSHTRDSSTFCGTDNVDVEDWLSMYERITARVLFDNHEDDLTSWDICKRKLRNLFWELVSRTLAAQKYLASCTQSATESYISCIQDVLAMCMEDDNMPEFDKVGRILKGIADDAFNLLVYKNSVAVDGIITECRRLEQAKSRWITQEVTWLANTTATPSCEDAAPSCPVSPHSHLLRIVRRELEAMTPAALLPPAPEPTPSISPIQAAVRQEFANMGL